MSQSSPGTSYTPTTRPERGEPLWRWLIGQELRDIRTSRDETLSDVARRAAISPQYLSEVERGIKEPSSEMIAAIATSLDTSLLELTSGVAQRLGADRGHSGLTQAAVSLAA